MEAGFCCQGDGWVIRFGKIPTLPKVREGWGTPKYDCKIKGWRTEVRRYKGGPLLRAGLEDAGEGLVVFGEEYEPTDGADQTWANADGEHEDVKDQNVDEDGAD